MAQSIMSCNGNPQFHLFLKITKGNPGLYWNYEPSWLWAKMELHPRELLQTQFEFLHIYVSDPETYEFLEEADLFGAGD